MHFLSSKFALILILLSPSEKVRNSTSTGSIFKHEAIEFPSSTEEGQGNTTTSFMT